MGLKWRHNVSIHRVIDTCREGGGGDTVIICSEGKKGGGGANIGKITCHNNWIFEEFEFILILDNLVKANFIVRNILDNLVKANFIVQNDICSSWPRGPP